MPSAVGVTLPGPADTEAKVPSVTPTVAETGDPVSGGIDGPGPLSGSLLDIRSSKSRNPFLHDDERSTGSSALAYESAEDEKKRLEREERERLLQGETEGDDNRPGDQSGPNRRETLPPYEEM
jgi:hypothetical protein